MNFDVQRKRYIYHELYEAPEGNNENGSPPTMAHNSRIAYQVMATIWTDSQKDTIRRYNVVRKEALNNPTFRRIRKQSKPVTTTYIPHLCLSLYQPTGAQKKLKTVLLSVIQTLTPVATSYPFWTLPPYVHLQHIPSVHTSVWR